MHFCRSLWNKVINVVLNNIVGIHCGFVIYFSSYHPKEKPFDRSYIILLINAGFVFFVWFSNLFF